MLSLYQRCGIHLIKLLIVIYADDIICMLLPMNVVNLITALDSNILTKYVCCTN